MKRFSAAAFILVLASGNEARAQSTPTAPDKIALGEWLLSPSLELRTRGEWRHDPPDLGGRDLYGRNSDRVRNAWGVMERSRFGLGAERGALHAQLTLQDARAFGAPTPSATFGGPQGIGRFGPYEAFIEMRGSSARPTYLKIGRQAMTWGEGRLLGTADFSPTGRSLDAIRAHTALGNFDFETFAALLESPTPLGSSFGSTSGASHSGVQLYGLTAKWTLDPLLRVEAFGFAKVARSGGEGLDGSYFSAARLSGETYTAALRVSGEAKGWDYAAEGAYQFGTASSLSIGGTDIEAYAAAVHVDKTLPEITLSPTFRVGASYASGQKNGSKYTQFDPLLPDVQRWHGQMDLFSWSNQIDVTGGVKTVPWNDTTFGIDYRYARLATTSGEWMGSYLTPVGRTQSTIVLDGTAPAGNVAPTDEELGHELDVTFAWRPWLPLELKAGWSGLLLGRGAQQVMVAQGRSRLDERGAALAAQSAQYAYLQATLVVP